LLVVLAVFLLTDVSRGTLSNLFSKTNLQALSRLMSTITCKNESMQFINAQVTITPGHLTNVSCPADSIPISVGITNMNAFASQTQCIPIYCGIVDQIVQCTSTIVISQPQAQLFIICMPNGGRYASQCSNCLCNCTAKNLDLVKRHSIFQTDVLQRFFCPRGQRVLIYNQYLTNRSPMHPFLFPEAFPCEIIPGNPLGVQCTTDEVAQDKWMNVDLVCQDI